MTKNCSSAPSNLSVPPTSVVRVVDGERGVALVTAIIVLGILAAISLSVLAIATTEVNIAGSDLLRTRTFYAASAGLEKMTSDFSNLFTFKSVPTPADLATIRNAAPAGLTSEGYAFTQTIAQDETRLALLRGNTVVAPALPTTVINTGPFAGLYGSVSPYSLTTTATHTATETQVVLQREFDNYLIPLFQFGLFSDGDMEIHPGPTFTFNGRVHANGNLYINGSGAGSNMVFLGKVTTANEFVYERQRNGTARADNISFNVSGTLVTLNKGSVTGGPFYSNTPDTAGYFPDAPTGTYNDGQGGRFDWNATSILQPDALNTPNRFGGQLLTRGTGGVPLKLPFQFERADGTSIPTREIIKRLLPMDSTDDTRQSLQESRYHFKAQVRVLIDDETAGFGNANEAGIPVDPATGAQRGVPLSTFLPSPLPASGGNALRRVDDTTNTYAANDPFWLQRKDTNATINWGAINSTNVVNNSNSQLQIAKTVRGTQATTQVVGSGSGVNSYVIPPGAGLRGRIYIGIIDANGVERDVTRVVLSMGITEGEPNAIVQLQRPLWAAFMQGSRDRDNRRNSLVELLADSRWMTDGEINNNANTFPANMNATHGYYSPVSRTDATNFLDDDDAARPNIDDPNAASNYKYPIRNFDTSSSQWWNKIVPINVYNPREGRVTSSNAGDVVYERGITNVVEINMRNLARWFDGVYDANLLQGTDAVSANIRNAEGYVVYISDRRGDRVQDETIAGGGIIRTTNGTADNEDIFNSNGLLDKIIQNTAYDAGEDVINSAVDGSNAGGKKGTLQKIIAELSDPGSGYPTSAVNSGTSADPNYGTLTNRIIRAREVASWTNPSNIFRPAVRLFNAEDLSPTNATGSLSTTKGITVATENMVYIWGNYNTTGITGQPVGGSTLNCLQTGTLPCAEWYAGDQVPTSIIADAFFPLSKTWFDSGTALYPADIGRRLADNSTTDITLTTSVRSAIIAGNNKSALSGNPDQGFGGAGESRLSGGIHNYPRFLENWGNEQEWNFIGCLIPLYQSTQALGSYGIAGVYSPPKRNWAFDETFKTPNRLPPGTPQFQYVEVTGFRQVF